MNLNELKALVGNITKALYENEKLPVPVMAARARRASENYPEDKALMAMASFLTRREDNNQTFISRKEFKSVYNKLYSPNTKCASIFSDELGPSEISGAKYAERSEYEGSSINVDYFRSSDNILSNALKSAFDKTIPYQPYSDNMAKLAEQACMQELNTLGVSPKKINIFAGNPDILVCNAVYETPKGHSQVLVPIEFSDNKPLLPTIFLSQAGFVDLSKEALTQHIEKTAGKAYNVNGKKILEVLSTAKFGYKEPMSKIAQAALQLRADKETPEHYTAEGIVYQKIDNPIPDVEMPEYEQSEEVKSFAKQLLSAKGLAEQIYGKDRVKQAENTLSIKLASCGYKNTQIALSDIKDDVLMFAVSVDGAAGFSVPMKIGKHLIEDPNIIISSGAAYVFNKAGIGKVLSNNEVDARSMAMASPLQGATQAKLIDSIRSAIADNNYTRAEEALNVLNHDYGPEAHAKGFAIYLESMKAANTLTKEASVSKSCSMIVEASNSKYPMCGHTGLPLHKVYQDEHGDCHPMYRKGMKDEEEIGTFMNHKVFI